MMRSAPQAQPGGSRLHRVSSRCPRISVSGGIVESRAKSSVGGPDRVQRLSGERIDPPPPMKLSRFFPRAFVAAAVSLVVATSVFAQVTGTALVRHAPSLNGAVEGSLQQLLPEGSTLNGGAVVTGDLLVPGTPTVRLNGNVSFGGSIDGQGSSVPSNYQITLNGSARLGRIVRRTDAIALPIANPPPQPTGPRSVTLTNTAESAGDFATLRNLTLNGGVGQFVVPA